MVHKATGINITGVATCPCCNDRGQAFHVRVLALRPSLIDEKALLATFEKHWEEMYEARIEDDKERMHHLIRTLNAFYPEVGFHANNQ